MGLGLNCPIGESSGFFGAFQDQPRFFAASTPALCNVPDMAPRALACPGDCMTCSNLVSVSLETTSMSG